MYNRPVLFDQSTSLVKEFSLLQERSKIAVMFDESGKLQAEAFLKEVNNLPTSSLLVTEWLQDETIREFISSQKIGTQIYIAAKWDTACKIFSMSVEEGASEEEIQTFITDEKKRYVYCMKCFNASEISLDEQTVKCSCGTHLEVGSFFSVVRKGYIGYPFIPVVQRQKVGS
ncbi:hypothetical protein [Psychrobacillus soli]|uniref:Uncharacterized protein n=1 Tax=Psychrobacillus soli TaxID=1543965 RepID=A0A544TFC1_9BACI|nr:hypothetical protein [Psychrobacillus soli]TQR16151.1 hypothetical protein FG383_07590 [Psychrobacillus soli]